MSDHDGQEIQEATGSPVVDGLETMAILSLAAALDLLDHGDPMGACLHAGFAKACLALHLGGTRPPAKVDSDAR
jgi:hypothetical protein